MSHWVNRIAVFDTETTGLSTRDDRIVTAYLGILGPEGVVEEERYWLADPGIAIPPRATAVHGITTERAQAEGRPAPEVVAEILEGLQAVFDQGLALVVYNATYDLSLTHSEALRYGLPGLANPRPVVDPLVIDRALDTYRRGKRTLDDVSSFYGVLNEAAHNARGDAITAGLVARALVERFPDAMADLSALHDSQVDWAFRWAESFRRYLESQGRPAGGLSGHWPIEG